MKAKKAAGIIEWIEQTVKVSDLTPYERNPRKISDAAFARLVDNIKANGYHQRILATPDLRVIGGHQRIKALEAIGMASVKVLTPDRPVSEAQFRELLIKDNLPFGEFDDAMLSADFTEDELLKWGMPEEWMPDVTLVEGLTDEDAVPEVPADPVTVLGDVWLLGGHRLMCGDSTKAEDVEKLMDGDRAVLCLTDPPYSVNYDKSHEQRGGNATVHGAYHEAAIDPAELLNFMALVPADVMIWSYPIDRHFHTLSDAYRKHGWEFKKELVWVKDSFSFWMSAKYQQKHEPIMLAVRSGCPIGGKVPANATTVFEYPRPTAHDLHPTAKPIALWDEFVGNHSRSGDILYDPFSGSGTTMIACEKTGRTCYGMELSPAYCDVIIKRFQDFTGKEATHAETGERFDSGVHVSPPRKTAARRVATRK